MHAVYDVQKCNAALSKSRLPDLVYSLNPYFGCEHACIYCYSPSVFRNEAVARNWGSFVKAKKNIAEVLAKELQRYNSGVVGVSTVTDPYQPAESKFSLTRQCLEILSRKDFPVSIQTKSNLVLRDLDIIKPNKAEVGVTLTSLVDEIARKIEPYASTPDSRVQVLEEFSSRGIKTWIFLGPIIPEVNDDNENIKKILEIAEKTKSRVLYDKLNLKHWVLERMAPVLEQFSQGLTRRMPELVEVGSVWWKTISSRMEKQSRELSINIEPAFK